MNWIGILCLSFVVLHPDLFRQASSEPAYAYAFFAELESGETVLRIVAPDNSAAVMEGVTLTTEPNYFLREAVPSPDGSWVALRFTNGARHGIELLDMRTLRTQEVISEILIMFPSRRLGITDDVITWSPDSAAFAFTVWISDEHQKTYVYHAAEGHLVEFTTNVQNRYDVAWSSSGRRIAVVRGDCPLICETATLDIFEVATETKVQEINVADILGGLLAVSGTDAICNLRWSPDDRYLSFMSSCDPTTHNTYKEIYLVDIAEQTAYPITDFTLNVRPDDPFAVRYANYVALWHNAETLVIGAVYANAERQGVQTYAYGIAAESETILSSEMALEIVRNQVTGQLGYVSAAMDGIDVLAADVRIANLDGGTLNILANHDPGCNLAWSPDGALLAYTYHGLPFPSCEHPILRISFLNAATGNSTDYIARSGEISTGERIIPVGWIRSPLP